MPNWGPTLVSPVVQSSYSNPSMSGYFKTMSSGLYDVIGNVIFYQPLHNQSYYFIDNGRHIGYLTEEIITAIDQPPYSINFGDYDNNNDGRVDMIQICFRSADTYELDWIAKHFGDRTYQGIAQLGGDQESFASGTTLIKDGKTIRAAALGSGVFCSGVTDPHGGLPVMVHEFGHYLFGARHFSGVGHHGLMDGAATGIMHSLERIKLGWITPILVNANLINAPVTDALTTNVVYKITAPNGSYFLIDNHQRQNFYELNWQQYNGGPLISPGTGILISHCPATSSSIDIESAYGRSDWNRTMYGWTNPPNVNWLYPYPFARGLENRIYGEDKLDIREKRIDPTDYDVKASHTDFRGSIDDYFTLSNNHIFAPWSNPSSTYDAINSSNISVVVKSSSTIDIYVNDIVITENTTYPAETFEFSHNLIVPPGVTLTLQTGTVLKFTNGNLSVNGTLIASGTTFTSSTSSNYWGGIFFNSGSNGNLNGCTIERVQAYGSGAVTITGSSPQIQNCIIRNNTGYCHGLCITYNALPHIYHNTIIQGSDGHGIYIYNANPYLRYNNITANTGRAAIYCDYYSTVALGEPSYPYFEGWNTLQNGYYGLYGNYYCYVTSIGGKDRFIGNSYANAYASNNTTMGLASDWWGQYPPNSSKIIAVSG